MDADHHANGLTTSKLPPQLIAFRAYQNLVEEKVASILSAPQLLISDQTHAARSLSNGLEKLQIGS